MGIELTSLEASRMYDLLVETERLHKRIAELERALNSALFCLQNPMNEFLIKHQKSVHEFLEEAVSASNEIKSVLGRK